MATELILAHADQHNPGGGDEPSGLPVWRDGTSTPSNGTGKDGDYYIKYSGSTLVAVYKRSSGTYAQLYAPGAAGGVASDTIFTAKGDLPVGTGASAAAALAVGTDFTHRLVADSSKSTGLSWLPHTVRRTADSAARNSGNTGTTLTNDDTLLLTVGASEVWQVEGWLMFNAANTAMDTKLGWSFPTGAVMPWGLMGTAGTGGVWEAVAVGSTPNALNAISASVNLGSVAGNYGCFIAGTYQGDGSHAGTLTLQWAQNTSDAGNLVLNKNSHLKFWRLA